MADGVRPSTPDIPTTNPVNPPLTIEDHKKNVGLVLPGGGANGAFSAHVAYELHKAGYEFSLITGISVGTLNGAMISTGSISTLIEMWDEITHDDIYDREWLPLRVIRMILGHDLGLHDTDPLKDLLARYYNPEDTIIPFQFGSVSLETREYAQTLITPQDPPRGKETKKAVRDLARASATVPLYANPVGVVQKSPRNDLVRKVVDGGLVNVAPLGDLFRLANEGVADVDRIIVAAPGSVPNKPDGPRRGGSREKVDHAVEVADAVIRIFTGEVVYNDVNSVLTKNHLIEQAEAAGVTLTSPSGRPYRHMPIDVIEPSKGMGSGTDFSEKQYSVRKMEARNQAREFISADTKEKA
jgi:NTE family protein